METPCHSLLPVTPLSNRLRPLRISPSGQILFLLNVCLQRARVSSFFSPESPILYKKGEMDCLIAGVGRGRGFPYRVKEIESFSWHRAG